MAKCPGCERELTGMEKLCRDCFDKQYAVVAAGKGGFQTRYLLTRLAAVVVVGACFFLVDWYFPGTAERVHQTLYAIMNTVATLIFISATLFGIYESLEWRTLQKLLFWTLIALNLAGLVMWHIRGDVRWLSLCLISFLINTGRSAYYKHRLA